MPDCPRDTLPLSIPSPLPLRLSLTSLLPSSSLFISTRLSFSFPLSLLRLGIALNLSYRPCLKPRPRSSPILFFSRNSHPSVSSPVVLFFHSLSDRPRAGGRRRVSRWVRGSGPFLGVGTEGGFRGRTTRREVDEGRRRVDTQVVERPTGRGEGEGGVEGPT